MNLRVEPLLGTIRYCTLHDYVQHIYSTRAGVLHGLRRYTRYNKITAIQVVVYKAYIINDSVEIVSK